MVWLKWFASRFSLFKRRKNKQAQAECGHLVNFDGPLTWCDECYEKMNIEFALGVGSLFQLVVLLLTLYRLLEMWFTRNQFNLIKV